LILQGIHTDLSVYVMIVKKCASDHQINIDTNTSAFHNLQQFPKACCLRSLNLECWNASDGIQHRTLHLASAVVERWLVGMPLELLLVHMHGKGVEQDHLDEAC